MVWNETFMRFGRIMESGKVMAFKGKVSRRDDEVRFSAEEVTDLEGLCDTRPVHLRFFAAETSIDDLEDIEQACRRHPGRRPIFLEFHYNDGRKVILRGGEPLNVHLTNGLENRLSRWMVNGDANGNGNGSNGHEDGNGSNGFDENGNGSHENGPTEFGQTGWR
jgi:DNA polymerase III alpha subunit